MMTLRLLATTFIFALLASCSITEIETEPISENSSLGSEVLHYVVVTFESQQDLNINDMKVSIYNFSRKKFADQKLRLTPLFLGSTSEQRKPMIVIRRFTDHHKASKYAGKHQTTIIYRKFQFLFSSNFVKNPRQNVGYACVFRLIEEKNNSEILPIHNYGLVLKLNKYLKNHQEKPAAFAVSQSKYRDILRAKNLEVLR